MKIKKSHENIEFINHLIDINDLNISMSEMFLSIINNHDIATKEELETLSTKFKRRIKDIYFDKIIKYWDIDTEVEDNEEILSKHVYPSIQECDVNTLLANPYYKNIKASKTKIGEYELANDKYKAYELFAFDDIHVDGDYFEHSSIGFYNKEIPFLALNQKGVTWMSVNPNEIKTMEKAINNAFGDVIVFGLGLGYFPYMISLKENVNKITIIERDQTIIRIFKEKILPQFTNKDKIQIIEMDALEYCKKPLNHDYAFVDLWHNAEDGLNLFIKFKSIDLSNNSVKFDYWLENSFYALLRRAFISLLYEQLNDYDASNYQIAGTEFDKIVNRYFLTTKNLTLNNVSEISDSLTDKKLLSLFI